MSVFADMRCVVQLMLGEVYRIVMGKGIQCDVRGEGVPCGDG